MTLTAIFKAVRHTAFSKYQKFYCLMESGGLIYDFLLVFYCDLRSRMETAAELQAVKSQQTLKKKKKNVAGYFLEPSDRMRRE